MTSLKNLNLAAFKRGNPLPAPRVIKPTSAEFEQIVRDETHMADAEIAVTDAIIDSTPVGAPKGNLLHTTALTEANIDDANEKLNRLVDDDFPFDESQLEAVGGMIQQRYACMIGAAGTGKTTLEKKLVDMLSEGLDEVDVSQYWKRGVVDEHDDYEIPERLIPSILMCSFTGRSTQMTKKNFPRSWHPNIMTIHRALGFYPEFYPDMDEETGEVVNKRRFVPSYTADNQMPWDIVIIDEAGMLGLDLWHQLYAAIKPGARIYMIGDINQLPPTHGKSILGFALAKWPTWELTHVHRQQGANNSIVDNAHRVLKGQRPIGDSPKNLSIKPLEGVRDPKEKMRPMLETLQFMVQDESWRFLTVDIDEEHKVAAIRIRQMLKLLQNKIYEPNRDVVITPINGFEQSAPGYALGQAPMNQELVTLLNQDAPRYIIDGGREKKNFAVGDKVMATVNDYEAGITNGMTGIIRGIAINGGYVGPAHHYGLISEVNAMYDADEDDDEDFTLDEIVSDSIIGMSEAKAREKKESGPASHIITVEFGEGEHAFTIDFATKSSVASLMLAYVATCHKMQGGECPLVFVICHAQNKRPLNREWLYTAITRGSHRVVLLQTRQGVGFAIGKQNIKGKTLREKIQSFAALTKSNEIAGVNLGSSVKVKLPEPASLVSDVTIHAPSYLDRDEPAKPQPEVIIKERIVIRDVHIHVTQTEPKAPEPEIVDGGDLTPEPKKKPNFLQLGLAKRVIAIENRAAHEQLIDDQIALDRGPKLKSQLGALLMLHKLTEPKPLMLTHNPETVDARPMDNADRTAKPSPVGNRLALLLAKQKKGTGK